MILQGFKIRKDTFIISLLAVLGGFVFGSLLLLVVTALYSKGILPDEDFTVATVGTLIAAILLFICYIIIGMFEVTYNFNQFIGFGMTRKNFFIQELITSYVYMIVLMAVVCILRVAEMGILQIAFYKQYVYEELFNFPADRLMIILICLLVAMPIVRTFLGCFILKFGNTKGFWALWVVWMVVFMSISPISDIMKAGPTGGIKTVIYNIVSALKAVPASVWWVLIGAAVIAMFVASWKFLEKKAVA